MKKKVTKLIHQFPLSINQSINQSRIGQVIKLD